jgi:putative intracellular protease/amidase
MKKLFLLIIMVGLFISCKKEAPKVLLYIEGESGQLGYMLTHEVGKMKEILTQSGYEVKIATLSGEILKIDSVSVTPDLKLRDVNIDDYAGFIMPCMATMDSVVTSEETGFVRKVVNAHKPIAAQLGAVLILAKAGILDGKKYAWADETDENASMFPEFKKGIYSGRGVVQDGLIITSGTCPWMAKGKGYQDGTQELTQNLVSVIKEGNK